MLNDVAQRDRHQRRFEIGRSRLLLFEQPIEMVFVQGHIDTSLPGLVQLHPTPLIHCGEFRLVAPKDLAEPHGHSSTRDV
jgi:hypothetical protein